jgi:hypothetical protein
MKNNIPNSLIMPHCVYKMLIIMIDNTTINVATRQTLNTFLQVLNYILQMVSFP